MIVHVKKVNGKVIIPSDEWTSIISNHKDIEEVENETEKKSPFSAIAINTKDFRFNREDANE